MKLFVYGTLLPEEIAYHQIKKYIDQDAKITTARAIGWTLLVRNGFPIAKEVGGESEVFGALLEIKPGKDRELFEHLDRYEGITYQRQSTKVFSISSKEFVPCEIYAVRQNMEGAKDISHYEGPELWKSNKDPLISQGLPILRSQFDQLKLSNEKIPAFTKEYWEIMIPIQGIYLVLCSMLERLGHFRCGVNEMSKTEKVTSLGNYNRFLSAFNEARKEKPFKTGALLTQFGSVDRSLSMRDLNDCQKHLRHWYTIRGNLTHQGKSSFRDLEILHNATDGLLRTLEKYISI